MVDGIGLRGGGGGGRGGKGSLSLRLPYYPQVTGSF